LNNILNSIPSNRTGNTGCAGILADAREPIQRHPSQRSPCAAFWQEIIYQKTLFHYENNFQV
jgi:hypothetical protein